MTIGRAAISACAAALIWTGQAVADAPPPPSIALNGDGVVSAPPDIAIISSGVVTKAPTASAALKANADAMSKVLAAAKAAGVEDRDVGTSGLSVQPNYEGPSTFSSERAPKLVGYEVRNSLTIRSRAIDRLGAVIDAIVQAGSNQIDGLGFDVSDREAKLDQARKAAIADAKRKAELYAAGAGMKLGPLLSLEEQASGGGEPVNQFGTRSKSSYEVETPIARGEQDLRVRVVTRWAIER